MAPRLADIADMAAKQPANEAPKCENPSRARPTAINGPFPPLRLGTPKSIIFAPYWQNPEISGKRPIYYTLAMLSECEGHHNIDILVPQIAHKATQDTNRTTKRHPGWPI